MMIFFLSKESKNISGFTLLEMTVVLILVGLLTGGLLMSLSKQRDINNYIQTNNRMMDMQRTILGFAVANGRLPCPATAENNFSIGTAGLEDRNSETGFCKVIAGYVPGVTLGFNQLDKFGFPVDEWGNRFIYAVTQTKEVDGINQTSKADSSFTKVGGMSDSAISSLDPSLRVCIKAPQSSLTCSISSTETNFLIKNAVVIILSKGSSGSKKNLGVDESENLDNDGVFVSHESTSSFHSGDEFNHIVTWISPYNLYHAMIQAGKLP